MPPSTTKSEGQLFTDQLSIDMRGWNPPAALITIDSGEWRGYTFVLILYGLELAHFEVRRDDPDAKPLNRSRLQAVPLGLLERELRKKVDSVYEQHRVDNPDAPPLFPAEDWPDPAERLRANRDDVKLARLAQRYVETLGQPKQAAQLAVWSREDPERGRYKASSIPKLIKRARERRLLTPTSKGQAGGQLTPRARALLAEPPSARERIDAVLDQARRREEWESALEAGIIEIDKEQP
jgi:hypothetical protein